MSGQKEDFSPIEPGHVRYYVCGVTVYDLCHLGHARTYVTFDVVQRWLRAKGLKVTYVRNFTDVDDKIINKAKNENVHALEVSARYIDEFYKDMDALGIERATIEPKVSGTLDEIIALIGKLIAGGNAYAVDGDVYFAVDSFPSYLKLSKRNVEDLAAGARVEVDERKKNPMDFALWKSAKPGEPSWDSPWGKGRPGWHIECSAMAFRHLGESLDIHAGGRDLIFPHHENEIAQSEAASHKTFAKYWMHSGMLNIDDEKMSKSLGNFFTIREVLRHVDAEAMRMFFLNAHYRSPVSFDLEYYCPQCGEKITREVAESLKHGACVFSKDDARRFVKFVGLDEAEKRLFYVYRTLAKIDELRAGAGPEGGPVLKPELFEQTSKAFDEAMDDDFNTAAALSGASALLSFANELCDKPPKPRDQTIRTVAKIAVELRRMGSVVGLFQGDPVKRVADRRERLITSRRIDTAAVEKLLDDRKAARAEKRFADADAVRAKLSELGVVVKDTAAGSVWDVQE
jgi:cysteinyl-tRNA synthetase